MAPSKIDSSFPRKRRRLITELAAIIILDLHRDKYFAFELTAIHASSILNLKTNNMHTVESTSIESLLNENSTLFNIPEYQRPYSWSNDNIDTFIADIESVLENNNDRHLLGMIVFCKTDESSGVRMVYDIIDGQQRVTTILLFLSLIRSRLEDLKKTPAISSDLLKEAAVSRFSSRLFPMLFNSSMNRSKIATTNESLYEEEFLQIALLDLPQISPSLYPYIHETLQKYNQMSPDSKDTYSLKREIFGDNRAFNQTSAKAKRVVKNLELLNQHLDKLIAQKSDGTIDNNISFYNKLIDCVLLQLQVVSFLVKNEFEAFKLFETMNDRGLSITAMDLIKNLALAQCRGDKTLKSQVLTKWKDIFVNTIQGSHLTFLRYSINCRKDFVSQKGVYEAFKTLIFTDQSLLLSELDRLQEYADYFQSFVYNPRVTESEDLGVELGLLQSTKTQQWVVLAMSIFHLRHEHGDSYDPALRKILRGTHQLVFTQLMRNLGSNTFEKFFPEKAKKIHDSLATKDSIPAVLESVSDELDKKLKEIVPLSIEELKGAKLEKNDVGRACCYAIQLNHLGDGLSLDLNLTLEHVFPQTPEDEMWPEFSYLDEEQKESACYSMGNMILLSKGLNSGGSNFSFETKLEKYALREVSDHFKFIDENLVYRKVEDWNPDIISKRTEEMAKALSRAVYGL